MICLTKVEMGLTHKQQWNKRHGFERDASHSITEIARVSKIPRKDAQEIYNRGVGAHGTNPSSVRRHPCR